MSAENEKKQGVMNSEGIRIGKHLDFDGRDDRLEAADSGWWEVSMVTYPFGKGEFLTVLTEEEVRELYERGSFPRRCPRFIRRWCRSILSWLRG